MKKVILTVFSVLTMTGMVMSQNETSKVEKSKTTTIVANLPVINWEKTSINLGKIPQGKPVSMTFSFTNTGNAPLILTNVAPGCGCTVADFSKESIAPGKKGFVILTYNAAAPGNFAKNATVTANTEPASIVLMFNGEVITETSPVISN